jgi:hypothetical protein
MVTRKVIREAYMGARQFKNGATENLSVKTIRKEILDESSKNLIDAQKKEIEDSWAMLSNQIIGQEHL